MRLPRDLTLNALVRALSVFGYEVIRQTGSHIRLCTFQKGEHSITIPNHDPLRVGTLAGIISDVADHLGLSKDDLLASLFGSDR